MDKPVFYLGNFKINDTIIEQVAQAAKNCKRDIVFLDHPIPYVKSENSKLEDYKSLDNYGCIAVYDGKANCQPFWQELEKIKNL